MPRPTIKKSDKGVTGLDIEPSGVSAARVSASGGLVIEEAAMAPLEPGILRDGDVLDVRALSSTLAALFKENKRLSRRVRVGVASQKIVVRVTELPLLESPKELAAAVRFQAADELPMPLDAAVLDHQPLDIVDTPEGPRQRVLIVAARRDIVDRVVAAVRGAGLRPEGIDLSAFAMIRALCPSAGDGETVLYLAVGGLTNLAVARGSACSFTRVSGAGLEGMAIDLAERHGMTLEHARNWLAKVGLEAHVDDVEGSHDIVADTRAILGAGVARIADDVRASLDFHHLQGASDAVSRAVLTGPAGAVPGFADTLAQALRMPVSVGAVEGAPEGVDARRVTVAAGLALAEARA